MKSPLLASALALGLAGSLLTSSRAAESLDLAGVWNATAVTEDGERSVTWTFTKDGSGFAGTSKDNESGDERKLDRVTIDGKKLTLEVDIERDGNKGIIKVVATQAESGELAGEWSLVGEDGTVYASGKTTAVREIEGSFAGDWKSVSSLPEGGKLESTLTLKDGDAGLSASFTGEGGNVLEVAETKAEGGNLRLEFEFGDDQKMDIVIEGKLDGADKIVGKWIAKGPDGGEPASGDWKATREAPSLAGAWDVTAALPDGDEYNGVLTLSREGDGYVGNSKSSEGEERKLTKVSVAEGSLEYSVPLERDGETGTITVKAKSSSGGSLAGKWNLTSSAGESVADGAWSAARQK